MNNYDESPDSDTRAELLAERNARRRFFNTYMAHPNPRDPDWPGHWMPEEDHDDEPEPEENNDDQS